MIYIGTKHLLKEQELAFREQLFWALEYNYTVVIHCRNAFDEIFSILKSFDKLPKGIFHCFSGFYSGRKNSVIR